MTTATLAQCIRVATAAVGDAFDLVSCAHWVHTGRHAPPVSEDPETGPDAARWSPKVVSDQ